MKHVSKADKAILFFVAALMMAALLFAAEGTVLYDLDCEITITDKAKRGNVHYLQVKLPDDDFKYVQTTKYRWESVERGDLLPVTVYYGALTKRPIKVVER